MKRFFVYSGALALSLALAAAPARAAPAEQRSQSEGAPAPQLQYDFGQSASQDDTVRRPCEGSVLAAGNGSFFFIYTVICQTDPIGSRKESFWLQPIVWV